MMRIARMMMTMTKNTRKMMARVLMVPFLWEGSIGMSGMSVVVELVHQWKKGRCWVGLTFWDWEWRVMKREEGYVASKCKDSFLFLILTFLTKSRRSLKVQRVYIKNDFFFFFFYFNTILLTIFIYCNDLLWKSHCNRLFFLLKKAIGLCNTRFSVQ